MTDGIPLIHADDRIGVSGMQPKGPFCPTTPGQSLLQPMESAHGRPPDTCQLHCEWFRVTINSPEGVHMGNPC
jgi:hypothetical protein